MLAFRDFKGPRFLALPSSPNTMIKLVLFDLGNVILPFDVMRLASRLGAYTHLSVSEIVDRLWNDEIAEVFETGKLEPQHYFERVSKHCGFKGLSYEEFIPLFNEIFDEDKDILTVIEGLKKNYKLGLISNTNPIHSSHIEKTYPLIASHFEKLWWSSEAGVRKPDPAIYQMALDHFSAAPQESVFIDDMPINIGSAKKLGINGILYKGVTSLKRDLSNLGVQY